LISQGRDYLYQSINFGGVVHPLIRRPPLVPPTVARQRRQRPLCPVVLEVRAPATGTEGSAVEPRPSRLRSRPPARRTTTTTLPPPPPLPSPPRAPAIGREYHHHVGPQGCTTCRLGASPGRHIRCAQILRKEIFASTMRAAGVVARSRGCRRG
jgi:hypothetical protein